MYFCAIFTSWHASSSFFVFLECCDVDKKSLLFYVCHQDKKQERLEREKRRQQNEMKNTTYQTVMTLLSLQVTLCPSYISSGNCRRYLTSVPWYLVSLHPCLALINAILDSGKIQPTRKNHLSFLYSFDVHTSRYVLVPFPEPSSLNSYSVCLKNYFYRQISKTHKMKTMSKKQLRQIKKRQVNAKTGEIEFVSPWGNSGRK